MSPQDIAGWFKWLSLEKALQYGKEGLLFYARPKEFFKKILNKPAQEIVVQLFFYFLIMLAIVITITSNDLKVMIRKIFISFTLQMAVSLLPALIGAYFTDKIFAIKRKFENYFFSLLIFCTCLFIFTSPIMAIPLTLYLETQKYEFLLISLILSSIAFCVTNIFYSRIIFEKLRYALVSSVLTCIIWNLFITIAIHTPSIDNYNSNIIFKKLEIDPVYAEYETLSDRVHLYDIFEMPSSKIEISYDNTTIYLFDFTKKIPYLNQATRMFNNTSGNNKKTDSLITNYKNSDKVLKTAIDSLKYERNKIFFNSLSKYYKLVIEYGLQPQDTSTYARKGIVYMGNKKAILTIFPATLSTPHVQQFLFLSKNMNSREEARDMALTPAEYISAIYFLPTYFLDRIFWNGGNTR